MNKAQRDWRNHRIAEGLHAGLTQVEIGRTVGISGPAVCQAINRNPELRRLRASMTPTEMARVHALRMELRELQRDIRRELRHLEDEVLAYEVDRAARRP